MCFNGAKSWQLGWHKENGHVIVKPLNASYYFFGRVIGVAEHGKNRWS